MAHRHYFLCTPSLRAIDSDSRQVEFIAKGCSYGGQCDVIESPPVTTMFSVALFSID